MVLEVPRIFVPDNLLKNKLLDSLSVTNLPISYISLLSNVKNAKKYRKYTGGGTMYILCTTNNHLLIFSLLLSLLLLIDSLCYNHGLAAKKTRKNVFLYIHHSRSIKGS